MFTSIAILAGLAALSFFMMIVLVIAAIMLLRGGKKPAAPVASGDKPSWSFVEPAVVPAQLSYREQIKIEKADAVAKLYSDLTEKQFIDETIADALKMFNASQA